MLNEATLLQQQGHLAEALMLCQRALVFVPDNSYTYHVMGVITCQENSYGSGIGLIVRSIFISPDIAMYHSNLGNGLSAGKQPQKAYLFFRKAIVIEPGDPSIYYNMGNLLQGQNVPEKAMISFVRATQLKPDYVNAHYNLGNVFHQLEEMEEAIASWREAAIHNPDFAGAYLNMGEAYYQLDSYGKAASLTMTAMILSPDNVHAYYNLGNIFHLQSRMDRSVLFFSIALKIMPDFVDGHNNLGADCQGLGWLAKAKSCFQTAISLAPDHICARNNLACHLLMEGNYLKGWHLYETRWENPAVVVVKRDFVQPQWRGEPGYGRTLLIHPEQGFGDSLLFCRYAPMAAAKGWHVIVEVSYRLSRLMKSLDGVEQIVESGMPLPHFDFHCPMMSLPLAFATVVETIPAFSSYLRADPDDVDRWRKRLTSQHGNGPRIGLVWSGDPREHREHQSTDQRRSIPIRFLAPLLDFKQFKFFSLQKTGPSAPTEFGLISYMDEMNDFADTAALVTNLDLVIAVDTAVAHLAAALGKPVWMLDRFDACWRWFRDREDTPWYPSMRLFRQPVPGDWESVIQRVRLKLLEKALWSFKRP